MPTNPSKEPARNRAERNAKFDEYYSRKTGSNQAEQRRAQQAARKLGSKFGLPSSKKTK